MFTKLFILIKNKIFIWAPHIMRKKNYNHDLDFLSIISHKSCVSCLLRSGWLARSVYSKLAFLGTMRTSWNPIHQLKFQITLSIKECNPNKDIIMNKPTIYIQSLETQILTELGPTSLAMPLTRQWWLLELFTQIKTHHMIKFLQPPPQDFIREVPLLVAW